MVKKLAVVMVVAFGLMGFAFIASAKAEGAGKIKRTTELKGIQGEVTWIKKDRIAVLYGYDNVKDMDNEMLLPFDKDIKLEHINSVADIVAGDTVAVQYEEVVEEGPDGRRASRRAKVISFIRPAPPKKPIKLDNDNEGQTLDSAQ